MCKKAFVLTLVAVMICAMLFSGCGMEQNPTLPSIDLDGSTLAGNVEYINGRTCLVRITEEDSHFDQDKVVYISYSSINGGKTIAIGDQVSFSYNYSKDVSEYNGEPHIAVNEAFIQ